jgi:hypothetical protein
MERDIFERRKQKKSGSTENYQKTRKICFSKDNFYRPNSWPKVTITEITRAITTSYVKEVWLGNWYLYK